MNTKSVSTVQMLEMVKNCLEHIIILTWVAENKLKSVGK